MPVPAYSSRTITIVDTGDQIVGLDFNSALNNILLSGYNFTTRVVSFYNASNTDNPVHVKAIYLVQN